MWKRFYDALLVTPLFLYLSLTNIGHGLAQTEVEKDAAALRFYKERAPGHNPRDLLKIHECTNTVLEDAVKLYNEGEELILKHQVKEKNVLLLIGAYENGKTLLADALGGFSLDAVPENTIHTYPRFVKEIDDSSVMIEAADLGSNSAAGHVAGISLLNRMIQNNTGMKLVFVHNRSGLLKMWYYFSRISEANPEVGMYNLSLSESFTYTNVYTYGSVTNLVRSLRSTRDLFGKNGGVLLERKLLEKNREENVKLLMEIYGNSQYIPGVWIPMVTAHHACIVDKLHKKIVDSLQQATKKIIQHFEKIEKDKSLSDKDKFLIFEKASTNMTNIGNEITDDMGPDSLTKPLAEFAKDLQLEEAAKAITEIGNYGKLVISVQGNYKTTAWIEGLDPLRSYLTEKGTAYELENTLDGLSFNCKDLAIVKHMIYEFEFEVELKSNDSGRRISQYFESYKDFLGESFYRAYQVTVEENIDASSVNEKILEKLKSYNGIECGSAGQEEEEASGSCDDSKSDEIIDLLGKGSINESNTDDFVVLVMGKKGSKKKEVANTLANLKTDSPSDEDDLIYAEYLNKPLNATYSVVSAPSFSKDKSSSQSTVAKFFTYRSVQSALGAKLIITIDEKSLSEDNGDIEETLDNAAKLIIGADNFHECVGWVVANVGLADGEKIADKAKTEADKLKNKLEEISKSEKASNETKTYLTMLFSEKDQVTMKIAILVNSEKLSDPTTFSENRQHLLDVFDKNLLFTSYESKEYNDLLGDNEKPLALCAAQKTKESIVENLDSMMIEAKETYKILEERNDGDYKPVFHKMDRATRKVSTLVHNTTELFTVQDSLTLILDFLAELEVNVRSDTLDITGVDVDFVSATKKNTAHSVIAGFDELTSYIENSRRWYFFLNKLEHSLSEYNIMSKRDIYKSVGAELFSKIRSDAAERDDVVKFIEAIDELPKEPLKKLLGEITPSLRKLAYLGYIVDRMFLNEMKMDCGEEVNLCQGTYLTVSFCLQNLCLPNGPIEINALNIVYLDQDIIKNSTTVSIFSPEWYIIGNRIINLDGVQGLPAGPNKAKSGDAPRKKGEDGKPGMPGAPGGNFLGVGKKFVKRSVDSRLKITTKGGNGSAGQSGGDGGLGPRPDKPDFCEACDDKSKTNFEGQGFSFSRHCRARDGSSTVCDLYMSKDGEKAPAGGNGGVPGLGGLSGSASIVSVDDKKVHATMITGKGSDGGVGRGGFSGLYQRGYFYITEEEVHWAFKANTFRYRWGGWKEQYETRSRNGPFGKDGLNEEGRKEPEGPKPPPDFPVALNRYKSYIRQTAGGKSKNPKPLRFYGQIENNQQLNDKYDIVSFADDFQRLETQSHNLKKKVPVALFFESLLPRLANYSGNGNHTDEVRKTLAFLYTVVLSTLSSQKNREGFIVIDIQEFLKTTITNMEKLKNLENDKIVQSYKDDYNKNVQKSIDECNRLIKNEIIPAVDNYKAQMTSEIESLSAEVAEMKKNAQIQKEALKKKRDSLRKSLVWRKAMSVVGGVVSLMSFLGPTAGAIGSAINAGARIVESVALSGGNDPTAALQAIPGAVNQQLTTVIQLIENKKSSFSHQLAAIEERIQQAGGADSDKNLKGIKDKVDTTKKELAKIDSKKLDPNALTKMNSLQTGVSKTLAEKKLAISKFQENDDKQDRKITAIGYMQAAVNAGDMIARDVSRIRQNDAQLEEVSQQMKENENTIRKLDKYEENIHVQMMPMVQNIMKRVDGLSTENAGKSHAALDVAQWKTEEYLADMRQTLKKMTDGFQASERVENVMNKIDRAIRTMTQVFQRIQDNQDKRDLAVFIADINSNSASEINVKDPFLNDLLRDIQISIKRHLILESFEKSYKSFTQAFFPFGAELIRDYGLPGKFQQDNSTENTVTFAKQRINEMLNKIKITETSITKYDQHIYNEHPFRGGDLEIFPAFYTWKYEDHKEAISRLLRGETIEMDADITKLNEENESKNAIKFNSLRLAFVAKDEDLQPKLDKVLNKLFVSLKTLGSFVYECNENYYEISNDNFLIRVSLVMNGDEPYSRNDVYKKVRANTAMFSPYGKWNITLDGKAGLKQLKEFQDTPMDLEMVGTGFYVDEDSDICDTDLNLIYNRILL